MAKLYRLVPDTTATVLTTGYLPSINEDLLYELGYISIPNEGYFGIYERGKGKIHSERDAMFFFDSPWSCVMGIRFLYDQYSRKIAKILEYDIPDDILSVSKDAFTNYENWQAKGKLVPLDLLQKKGSTVKSTSKLKGALEESSACDIEYAAESLSRNYSEYSLPEINAFLNDHMKRINERRFADDSKFFKSDFITGKSMIVTSLDSKRLFSVIGAENRAQLMFPLIDTSNGILTTDNLAEYEYDFPFHEYGPIL